MSIKQKKEAEIDRFKTDSEIEKNATSGVFMCGLIVEGKKQFNFYLKKTSVIIDLPFCESLDNYKIFRILHVLSLSVPTK